jgi:hypothetical protein
MILQEGRIEWNGVTYMAPVGDEVQLSINPLQLPVEEFVRLTRN